MTILYSNGCSYTANNWVTPQQKYPYLVSQALEWDLVAASIPGSCNSRIIRCTMRDVINLRQCYPASRIVALVQLTHLIRFEYPGTRTDDNQWMYAKNDCFQSIKPANEATWPEEAKIWAKHSIMLYDPTAALEQLLCSIIGMISLFETLGVEYKIFSGPKLANEVTWPRQNIFYDYLKTNSNVLNLETFSMLLDLTGLKQHPDPTGMQKIADYFINQVDEQA